MGIRFDDIFENYVPKESNVRLFVNVLPQIRKIGSELAKLKKPDWTTVWEKDNSPRNRNSGISRLKILSVKWLLLAMKMIINNDL